MASIAPYVPVPIMDTFSRAHVTTSGVERWGVTDSGAGWRSTKTANFTIDYTNANTDDKLNIGEGKIAVSANSTFGTAWISMDSAGIPNQGDTVEVLSLLKFSASAAYPQTDFGLCLNRVDALNFYFVTMQGNYGEIAIGAYIGGTRWELDRRSKAVKPDTYYWVRFQRDGAMLYVKVWERGTVEPTAWTLSTKTWTGSNPPGAGSTGIFYKGTTEAYTAHVDSFFVYTKEAATDAEPGKPALEDFDHNQHRGWGRASSGHTWQGHFGNLPDTKTKAGMTSGGLGQFAINDTGMYYGFFGPHTTSAIETYAEWECNAAVAGNKVHLYFGLHCDYQPDEGFVRATGYAARVRTIDNTIQIMKRTSLTGGWTQIATATLPFTTAANTRYRVKFQKSGSTLRANCWLASGAEPSAWQVSVVDTDITTGGRCMVSLTEDVAAERLIKLDFVYYRSLTALPGGSANTTMTTMGTFAATAVTDSTITYRLQYTNDSDNDNDAEIRYRKVTDSVWVVSGPTKTTGTSPKTFDGMLTGLDSGTQYQVQITVTDPDEVEGINPKTITVTTTNKRSLPKAVTAHNVGTNTATLKLLYDGDDNANATATLEGRTLGAAQSIFGHSFAGTAGTALESVTENGFSFARDPASWGTLRVRNKRVYLDAQSNESATYYTSVGSQNATLATKLYLPSYDGTVDFIGRGAVGASNLHYRVVMFWVTAGMAKFTLYANTGGTLIILDQTGNIPISLDTFYDVSFEVTTDRKSFWFDGVEILRHTSNGITGNDKLGIMIGSKADGPMTYGTSPMLYGFDVTGRTTYGSWAGYGAMTANVAGSGPFPSESHRYFTANVTGLAADTAYEFRATLADSDGITGLTGSRTTTLITNGNKAYLVEGESMSVTRHPTSLTLSVAYFGDADDDSSLVVQYKTTDEHIWTTTPASFVTADRGAKRFRTTLSGLRTSTTYDILVTLLDPDGIQEGRAFQDRIVSTTLTLEREKDKALKQYQYKVYDADTGKYVSTWHDAGAPNFSFQENSGVSDLTVKLPRPISVLNDPATSIQMQNQVDVWVTDTFDYGFGPNMLEDGDFNLGAWFFTSPSANVYYHSTQGVDGGRCLKIEEAGAAEHIVLSEPIYVDPLYGVNNNAPATYNNRRDFRDRTFVFSLYAKASVGTLRASVFEYADDGTGGDNQIAASSEQAQTVEGTWQKLVFSHRVESKDTRYIRLAVWNDGPGTYWMDKAAVQAKEQLIYSGHIEAIKTNVDGRGEYIEIEVLGESSVLSDDYIDFLQFVKTPMSRDKIYKPDGTLYTDDGGTPVGKVNRGPMDPSNMLKEVIDIAQAQNPKCRLYYTAESIKNTGTIVEYTFRQKQMRAIFDKIRELAPPGWHYLVMPDGLVVFRGPEHATTHLIRIGVEATDFKGTETIRNLKNYVFFKGRQDDDFSEADGFGSIYATAINEKMLKKYGKRMLYEQDSSITTPDTAQIYADGKLDELSRVENRVTVTIVDEKAVADNNLGFRGYNIESILPGDYVIILNPRADPRKTLWDRAAWDKDMWDYATTERVLPESVPIKAIVYDDNTITIDLSQRPPSATGDFQMLNRWLQRNAAEKGGGE